MMDQKESENISDNLRWSIDMRMRTGKYNACFAPFGYQLVGGKLELILEQAPIIRYIYDAYLAGTAAGADNALPKEPSPEGASEAVRRQPTGLGGTAGTGPPEPPDPVSRAYHLLHVGG